MSVILTLKSSKAIRGLKQIVSNRNSLLVYKHTAFQLCFFLCKSKISSPSVRILLHPIL